MLLGGRAPNLTTSCSLVCQSSSPPASLVPFSKIIKAFPQTSPEQKDSQCCRGSARQERMRKGGGEEPIDTKWRGAKEEKELTCFQTFNLYIQRRLNFCGWVTQWETWLRWACWRTALLLSAGPPPKKHWSGGTHLISCWLTNVSNFERFPSLSLYSICFFFLLE